MKNLYRVAVVSLFLARLACGQLALDVNTSRDRSSSATTIATPAFSTAVGNELLLAFVSSDASSANMTVKSVTGAGLTWALVVRSNAQLGTAEIWRAFASSKLTNVTVTASLAQSVAASITVVSFTGVDTSGTNGAGAVGAFAAASGATGAPSASLVTTRNGSWVFGVGTDWDGPTARTPASGQTLVHQYLATIGDTYWVQRQNSTTPLSGTSVSISDTAPTTDRWDLSICEILPAGAAVADTTPPAVSISSPASGANLKGTASVTASATDNVAVASVQFLLDGSALGQPITSAPYSVSWDTTTATGGTHTLSATATDTSGNPATSSAVAVNVDNQAPTVSVTAPADGATVTGTASISASASDNTAVVGVQFLLDGATLGSEKTTAPYSVNWDSTTSTNGVHSLAARARDAAGNIATSSAVSVSVSNTAPAGLAIDVVAPGDKSSTTTTISTPAFTTHAGGELLLALIAADAVSPNMTVSALTGGGLNWALVRRTNVQAGTAEIWRAYAPTILTNAVLTATLSQGQPASITVVSFTGADASGTNGSGAIGATGTANGAGGTASATLTTTRNGSWVLGVGNDYSQAVARTVGSNQSLIHQYFSSTGDTYWSQRQNSATPLAGTAVAINDSAPTGDIYNLTIAEVLPASSSVPQDTTPPSVTMTSPAANATVSSLVTVAANASDNVAVGSVQFLLDGANLGSAVSNAPYAITWNSASASAGVHTLSAIARDTTGNTATASAVSVTVDNSGNPAVVGSWSAPVSLPAVAVNLVLLPNNKLLFYEDGATVTVWDYVANTFVNAPTSVNIFCSGHALLADGRVLIVGGYGGSGTQIGISNAAIFNPADNSWSGVPNMAFSRWYPTATTLSDGRVLVTAGWQTTNHTNAGVPEIYDPALNTWTQLTGANNPFETYPFIYLLPDGKLIHVGGTEYATNTDVLDISTQSWSVMDSRTIDGGSSTMYLPGKIMKAGSATDSQNSGPSANTTFLLDTTQTTPAWQPAPPMAYPRSFLNPTELPDGSVLATGGETDKNGGVVANAVYAAELWSPTTQTWSTMSSMKTPREYHATALLLPDGRVVVSGMGADFGNVPDEKTAEFFSPPYLFKGPRPTIGQAPTQLSYGQSFFIGTPDSANVAKVVLIRSGAVTHFFDQNTRYVPLLFQQTTGGLTVTAPANGNAAPPGHYMLFIVDGNGVPSVAPILKVGP